MSELLDLIEPGEVRAALDPAGLLLDGTSLPTGVILRQVFAGAAVTEVVYRDPDAGTREGTALQRIANALNLLTAANIAPFVVQITREQLDEVSTTYQAVDWAARGRELRARARAEVAAVTERDETAASAPTMFTLACGRRGR
jgi:hypothetical protein